MVWSACKEDDKVHIMVDALKTKKKVTCCKCKRTMETVHDENPPYFCWKCGDKLEIGGYHEIHEGLDVA